MWRITVPVVMAHFASRSAMGAILPETDTND
jgi:hypothetical protein